ncbi:MAG: tetraacyldisaccharide 4'-kinase [Candidatus Gastranaerophilales bacterium]|nr:tetraacyldisaccharide 4'-kinase [Candidatus Gastranaerophilales bacterium]
MKNLIAKLHYKKELDFDEKILCFFLAFLSFFYSAAVKLRLLAYKSGILKTNKVKAFVISIGNITTGGTGKTPVCVALANYISNELGKNTALLSRGYGGKLNNTNVHVISDGKNIFHSAYMGGDEPYWLAFHAQNTSVLTCRNRVACANEALKNGAEVLILDDGFQHLKLYRDFNVLLIDGNLRFGNTKPLPLGPLREPLSEIKRADYILIMNKRAFDDTARDNCRDFAVKLSEKYAKPAQVCNFKPDGIFNLKNHEILPQGGKIYAFCAIARPEFFFSYLEKEDFEIVKRREFTDHHLYTPDDVSNIVEEAKKLGVSAIVTTEKDGVKLKAILDENTSGIDFYTLKLGLDIDVHSILKNINIL